MVTVEELLEKYRSAEMPERDKGAKFERLMKNFLLTNPVYRGKFSEVGRGMNFLFVTNSAPLIWVSILFAKLLTENFGLSNVNSMLKHK